MEWLSQNWLWIGLAAAAVALLLMTRMGGCGMGHRHQGHAARGNDVPNPGGQANLDRTAAPAQHQGHDGHKRHGCC